MATLTQEDVQSLTKLQAFLLQGPLSLIGATNDDIAKLVTTEFLYWFWQPAFTMITYSPDVRFNYENLEASGDVISKAAFHKYMQLALPGMTPLIYTELSTYYMSNEYMKGMSEKLGFVPFIRTKGMNTLPDSVVADVFEAFCGALALTGDTLANGEGFNFVFNLIVSLFNGVQFDMKRAMGSSRTQVEQIFSRFGTDLRPKPELDHNPDPSTTPTTARMYLTTNQLNFLDKHGINIPKKGIRNGKLLVSTVTSDQKKEATNKVFEDLGIYLEKYGVTTAWSENLKNILDFNEARVKQHVAEAKKRLGKEGYASMTFSIPTKASSIDGFTLLLVGIKPDGTRNTLVAKYFTRQKNISVSDRNIEARAEVTRIYASGLNE